MSHGSSGNKRIALMPDCDEENKAAFKELLRQFSGASIDVEFGCRSEREVEAG